VAGLCADTEAKALRLKAHYANDFIQINLWGTAEQCREQLETLCERYGTRSCMFFDVQPSVQDRLRSYEALAQTLGLAAPTPIAPLTVA
jgi:alkanesulfonate monooxygenase SsuD/methylene tetrahydromethanopterin reductase-like flavin-dependent oxidoreductase (luciferase family)